MRTEEVLKLPEDERLIYRLLNSATKNGRKELTMEDLEEYAQNNSSLVSAVINKMHDLARDGLVSLNKINENIWKITNKYQIKRDYYSTMIFFSILSIIGIPLIPLWIVMAIKCNQICKLSENVLNEEAYVEKKKWHALKKYLEEFSLLKEKDVPDLVLWEKYLVYATAFGISKKVIKKLKAMYPEIDSLIESSGASLTYLNSLCNNDFGGINSISSFTGMLTRVSYTSNSSGGGYGGGSSSGGGGGRRWWKLWRPLK